MNKNSKKLKGFTLIELIVVMAIFSIIMLAALKLVDPVEKVMNNTSVQEKNAAYVDNMEDYLHSSLKYAEFLRVYEGDFCKSNGVSMQSMTEQEAVTDFVRTFFDGRIDASYNPVEGKIRVLKIYNSSAADVSGDNYDNGKIVETVWSFTAGDSYIKETPALNPSDPPIKTTIELTAPAVTLGATEMVINPDYYNDYSFFFKLGYHDFTPLSDTNVTNYGLTPDPKAEYYYGELIQGKDYNGNNIPFGQSNFALSVVTYETGNKQICLVDDDSDPLTPDVDKTVFKSPFYMSSSSMALMNIIPSNIIDDKYYQVKQDNAGNDVYESGKKKLELTDVKGLPFEHFKYDAGDNIYFIYVLPGEIEG